MKFTKKITLQDIKKMNEAACNNPMMPDNENPAFAFNGIHTDILVAIATGKLDAKMLAKYALKANGLDENGKFIGFK